MTRRRLLTVTNPGGNYVEKVAQFVLDHPAVGVNHIMVRHEHDCRYHRGLPCDCDPDIENLGPDCPGGEE